MAGPSGSPALNHRPTTPAPSGEVSDIEVSHADATYWMASAIARDPQQASALRQQAPSSKSGSPSKVGPRTRLDVGYWRKIALAARSPEECKALCASAPSALSALESITPPWPAPEVVSSLTVVDSGELPTPITPLDLNEQSNNNIEHLQGTTVSSGRSFRRRKAVNYSAKEHPQDYYFRPATWQRKYGSKSPNSGLSKVAGDESDNGEDDADQASDHSECGANISSVKTKESGQERRTTRTPDPSATRFSHRAAAHKFVDYDRRHHPQDSQLPFRKRKLHNGVKTEPGARKRAKAINDDEDQHVVQEPDLAKDTDDEHLRKSPIDLTIDDRQHPPAASATAANGHSSDQNEELGVEYELDDNILPYISTQPSVDLSHDMQHNLSAPESGSIDSKIGDAEFSFQQLQALMGRGTGLGREDEEKPTHQEMSRPGFEHMIVDGGRDEKEVREAGDESFQEQAGFPSGTIAPYLLLSTNDRIARFRAVKAGDEAIHAMRAGRVGGDM